MPNTQPDAPYHHPRRISNMTTNRGHNQNRCSKASRDRASLVSRSSPSYALSRARRSSSSHLWRKTNRCSLCESLSPSGVLEPDSLSDTFFSGSERNTLRQRVSSRWLGIETFQLFISDSLGHRDSHELRRRRNETPRFGQRLERFDKLYARLPCLPVSF